MTALPDRRRRNTIIAAAMAGVGVLLAAVITIVGASTLADSRAGRDVTAGGGIVQLSMPPTSTALMAVVDDDGELTNVVAMVLRPDGVGGSLVVVPASADSVYARIGDVFPLAETLQVAGADRMLSDAEAMLAISFDVAEVVDAARLAELLEPLGELEVAVPAGLPVDVPGVADEGDEGDDGGDGGDGDVSTDDIVGMVTVTAEEAAALLTLRLPADIDDADADSDGDETAPDGEAAPDSDGNSDAEADGDGDGDPEDEVAGTASGDRLLDPLRTAVWRAVGAEVGDGSGAVDPVDVSDGDAATVRPADLDEFVERLFSAPVGVRSLRASVPNRDQNPRGVDAVLLDRPEVLLVFGQIAPGRVAAPNDSLTFRIEAHFSDEQLAPFGVNNSDVVRDVIQILLFLRANVVSVETSSSGAPEVTDAFVADPTLVTQVEEGWEVLFGDVDVVPAEEEIAGVDASVVLGESYLERRETDLLRISGGEDD